MIYESWQMVDFLPWGSVLQHVSQSTEDMYSTEGCCPIPSSNSFSLVLLDIQEKHGLWEVTLLERQIEPRSTSESFKLSHRKKYLCLRSVLIARWSNNMILKTSRTGSFLWWNVTLEDSGPSFGSSGLPKVKLTRTQSGNLQQKKLLTVALW